MKRKIRHLSFLLWPALCLALAVCACTAQPAQQAEKQVERVRLDAAKLPAWVNDYETWEQARQAALGKVEAETLGKLALSPNPIIAQAAIDALRGQGIGAAADENTQIKIWRAEAIKLATAANNEPFAVTDGKLQLAAGKWDAYAVPAGHAIGEKHPLLLRLPENWADLLAGAAVEDAVSITPEGEKRLSGGRPQIVLLGEGGRVVRIWADGSLAGPHAQRAPAGLWRLTDLAPVDAAYKLWVEHLAQPGRGDAEHFARIGALIDCGEVELAEKALLALDTAQPASAPVQNGDVELALYTMLRDSNPQRAQAYLKRLVTAHPTHPFVSSVGLFAYSRMLFEKKDWAAYRELWQGAGRQALGEVPPAIQDRLAIVDELFRYETQWNNDPAARGGMKLRPLVDDLGQLGDYERQLLWVERHLATIDIDHEAMVTKARCLMHLQRDDEAEQVLLAIADDKLSSYAQNGKIYEMLIDFYKTTGQEKKVEWAHKEYLKARKQMGMGSALQGQNPQ